MRAFLICGMILVGGLPVAATAETCSYRIDNPGHGSISTSSQRIDRSTVEHTTTTTIGRGARGAGTLIMNTDGTYEIKNYLGLGPSRKGRWIVNDEGPFSDKGGVELLDVKGPDYGADQRSWFMYTNDEGQLVGREPPYTGFNDLRFTSMSGGACAPRGQAAAAAGGATKPGAATQAAQSPQAALVRPAMSAKVWTHQGFREHFMGKNRAQVEAELGKPHETGYKKWVFHRLTVKDANDPSVISHSATISFTDQESGQVWHIYFS